MRWMGGRWLLGNVNSDVSHLFPERGQWAEEPLPNLAL